MNFNKIKSSCRIVRILAGLILIAIGIITSNYWFFLGIAPLIVGVTNFCPLCMFTKKCDLPQKK